jgi:hypothetical protein
MWVELLQRDPDPEEPEAPLVEAGIPSGRFVVAVVVDGPVPPLPAGRRKRPIPRRPWRRTVSPRCGPVTPRGTVEVAALGIAAPRAARTVGSGTAGMVGARATGMVGAWTAGMVRAGSAGAIGMVGGVTERGPAGTTRTARATGSARVTGSTRIIGAGRRVEAPGRRPTVVSAGSRLWLSWRGECRTGTHTQRCSAKGARDGSPRD